MFTEKDFLHCEGHSLVTADGRRVVLRGTNLGGWLHREGWMDGAGACLLPVAYTKKEPLENGVQITFGKVVRINRLRLPENIREEEFQVKASLDGETWTVVGEGRFSEIRESVTDHQRPAPYAPRVNVYDEGCFVCGNLIHTNEFFARYLRVSGIQNTEPFRYGDVDDYSARTMLQERFGERNARELLEIYQKAYLTEADLSYLKSLGFSFLRVPIYWQEIIDEKGNEKENAWGRLDWLISRCRELELYVMLDFHGAPGGNTIGSITAGQLDSNDFWTSEEYQELAQKVWKLLGSRYREEPTVACYDLINEPCAAPVSYTGIDMEGVTPPEGPMMFFGLPERLTAPVRRFYRETVKRLRDAGDRHVLCIQQFLDPELVPFEEGWENIMYQVHCYPEGDFRDSVTVSRSAECYLGAIRKILEKTEVPLLVGEFNLWGFPEVWEKWLGTLQELSVSWASWSYKITDPAMEDNWSLRYDFQGTFVDYLQDSRETIAEKWAAFRTENYRTNRFLEEILSRYARAGY